MDEIDKGRQLGSCRIGERFNEIGTPENQKWIIEHQSLSDESRNVAPGWPTEQEFGTESSIGTARDNRGCNSFSYLTRPPICLLLLIRDLCGSCEQLQLWCVLLQRPK